MVFSSPNSSRALLELNNANVWSGQLDLKSNDMLILGGASAFTTVNAQVASGYNHGTWTGQGITSSSAATNTFHLTALGVILNTPGLSFDGAPALTTAVLVKYTYYGDADLSGKVDGGDYTRIDAGHLSHFTGWYNGDFNYDGVVDGSDYALIDNSFKTRQVGLEPTTSRLTAGCSTIELLPNLMRRSDSPAQDDGRFGMRQSPVGGRLWSSGWSRGCSIHRADPGGG